MQALLIVDVQNDFCPGGALACADGDKIMPVINTLIGRASFVIASRDWHPAESVHFDKWPVHCVAGSPGAELHPELNRAAIELLVSKGTNNADDGYSAFEATSHDLAAALQQRNVTDVTVCGIATDYCVKASVLDALKHGFKVTVVADAIAAVAIDSGNAALREMAAAGATIVKAAQLA